jgi:hypothetical protein
MMGICLHSSAEEQLVSTQLAGGSNPSGGTIERGQLIIYFPVLSKEITVPNAHLTLITSEETNLNICQEIFNEILKQISPLPENIYVKANKYSWFGDNRDMLVLEVENNMLIQNIYAEAKHILNKHNQILDTRYQDYTPHITVNGKTKLEIIKLGTLQMSHKLLGT